MAKPKKDKAATSDKKSVTLHSNHPDLGANVTRTFSEKDHGPEWQKAANDWRERFKAEEI